MATTFQAQQTWPSLRLSALYLQLISLSSKHFHKRLAQDLLLSLHTLGVVSRPHHPAQGTSIHSAKMGAGKDGKTRVVIIGAGIGGVSTAARLAKAGLEVIVVEKVKQPKQS